MIRSMFTPEENEKLIFIYLRDFRYQDGTWVAQVQAKVDEIVSSTPPFGSDMAEKMKNVGLIYSRKEGDRTTYYLDILPYDKIKVHTDSDISSTELRSWYFLGRSNLDFNACVHDNVKKWLKAYKNQPSFFEIKEAYEKDIAYGLQYADNEFPQINVTTDFIVECSGHVLLIRRKFNPGKALLALPGGYVEADLLVEQSALKELKEETRIKVSPEYIQKHVVASRHFDDIDRDLRCRTITFAYYTVLPNGPLPQVKGSDDAAFAKWIPKSELPLFENQMYADHFHILNWFFNNCAVSAK